MIRTLITARQFLDMTKEQQSFVFYKLGFRIKNVNKSDTWKWSIYRPNLGNIPFSWSQKVDKDYVKIWEVINYTDMYSANFSDVAKREIILAHDLVQFLKSHKKLDSLPRISVDFPIGF